MSGLTYLGLLILGIMSMLLIDWRHRLFFWRDAKAAAIVTAVSVGALLVADAVGIAAGVFFRGDTTIATGVVIAPEIPVEEPVFLLFLVLLTAVTYAGALKVIERRAGGVA